MHRPLEGRDSLAKLQTELELVPEVGWGQKKWLHSSKHSSE